MKLNKSNLEIFGRLVSNIGKVTVEISQEHEEGEEEEYEVRIYKDQKLLDIEEYKTLEDILLEWDIPNPWFQAK